MVKKMVLINEDNGQVKEESEDRIERINEKYKSNDKGVLQYGDIIYFQSSFDENENKGIIVCRSQNNVRIYDSDLS